MVPPFDHDDIIEGQATVAAEIAEQLPDGVVPDLVILPVGGGGLSAGITGYLAMTLATRPSSLPSPQARRASERSLETG